MTSPAPALSTLAPLPARRRERPWIFLFVLLLAAAAILAPVLRERWRARRMVQDEDLALVAVRAVAEAEGRFRDARGRYGWLEDLADADLLEGMALVEVEDVRRVVTRGYRIDVLLPHGRLGASGVALTPRGIGRPPPELSLCRQHMAVVARPLEPGVTGWRMWYLDERGEVYLNEGVVDQVGARRNELPERQITHSEPLQSGSPLLWQRLDENLTK